MSSEHAHLSIPFNLIPNFFFLSALFALRVYALSGKNKLLFVYLEGLAIARITLNIVRR